MTTKTKYIQLFASELEGIALDWAVGLAMGHKLKLIKAGEFLGRTKLNRPCVCYYNNSDHIEHGVSVFPKLLPFKPTEDFEQLPDNYKESFDYVHYTTIETRGSGGVKTYDAWLAVNELHEEGEPAEYDFHEGNTKLEAICKAYVADKMRIIDIPEEVINCI